MHGNGNRTREDPGSHLRGEISKSLEVQSARPSFYHEMQAQFRKPDVD